MRTLDVFAAIPIAGINKLARLIVECKTTDHKKPKPWVFFQSRNLQQDIAFFQQKKTIPLTDLSIVGMTALSLLYPYIDNRQESTNQVPPEAIACVIKNFPKIHYSNSNLPIAHSCYVAFRNAGEDAPDSFQKAINQLRAASLELASGPYHSPIFAVIVFGGDLYRFCKTKEGKHIEPVNHVLFYTLYLQPEEFEGEYILPEDYQTFPPVVVDVVKDTFFGEYLQMLKKDLESLKQIYTTLEEMKK